VKNRAVLGEKCMVIPVLTEVYSYCFWLTAELSHHENQSNSDICKEDIFREESSKIVRYGAPVHNLRRL
jgi:hypothetical protein